MQISVFRRERAGWLTYEWYNWDGVKWLQFGVHHPLIHKWWSFTVYLYF